MLRLPDHWVWDSWIADDGDDYHLFYLKAPRALGDPARRHENAVIGHATSGNLIDWAVQPDALHPSMEGWDSLALWTGSTVQADDGTWRMFYTALRRDGHGIFDQRIGVALSSDLSEWHRVGDAPVVEADKRWYKTLAADDTSSETWRDPFVFRDPDGDGWHMHVTARIVGAHRNRDGVVAHAWSPDLTTWEIREPVSNHTEFGQIEVAQVREIDGQHVMVFTCHPQEQSEALIGRYGEYCTWSLVGPSALGPWDLDLARPFLAEPDLFAAPLVQQRDGSWALVGFRNLEPKGTYAFHILDPIAVRLIDGSLQAVDD